MSWYFLGGLLGVLDGPVRPVLEPLRVLAHVGMVGRALERDVERDLDPCGACRRHQMAEVLEGAEVGVHGLVAAQLGADRPGAAEIVRLGLDGVVAAFPVGAPNRVDRWQVEHVEAHPGDIGQTLLGRLEGAVAALGAGGAGEHLVPAAEPGQGRVDRHLELGRVTAGGGAVRVARDERLELRREGRLDRPRRGPRTARAELAGRRSKRRPVRLPGPVRGLLDQAGAGQQVDRHVLAGLDPLRQVAGPGPEVVDPALDREAVGAQGAWLELGPPAVVGQGQHRRFRPLRLTTAAVEQHRPELVVAVGEAVGLDPDALAQRSLGRISPSLDLRGDALDDYAARLDVRQVQDVKYPRPASRRGGSPGRARGRPGRPRRGAWCER